MSAGILSAQVVKGLDSATRACICPCQIAGFKSISGFLWLLWLVDKRKRYWPPRQFGVKEHYQYQGP